MEGQAAGCGHVVALPLPCEPLPGCCLPSTQCHLISEHGPLHPQQHRGLARPGYKDRSHQESTQPAGGSGA